LSYAPARGTRTYESPLPASSPAKKMFEQQTPRRWGWGTPLKKRAATRTTLSYATFAQPVNGEFYLKLGAQNPPADGQYQPNRPS